MAQPPLRTENGHLALFGNGVPASLAERRALFEEARRRFYAGEIGHAVSASPAVTVHILREMLTKGSR